jgi:hypothetical protein
VATEYRPDSPLAPVAWRALDVAIAASGDSVLAEQAALIYAARSRHPIDPAWWAGVEAGVRARPNSADNQGAMAALVECAIQALCPFPRERMVAMFDAALSRQPAPGTFSLYGRYALHGLRDTDLALRLWHEAVARAPNNPMWRANLARLLIDLGHVDEAATEVAAMRGLGRYRANDALIADLEARLALRRRSPSPIPP